MNQSVDIDINENVEEGNSFLSSASINMPKSTKSTKKKPIFVSNFFDSMDTKEQVFIKLYQTLYIYRLCMPYYLTSVKQCRCY